VTTPTPPAPEPQPSGFAARLRAWFERDVEPGIIAAQADIAKIKALGPAISAMANTVAALAKAADPAAAPEIAALAADAEHAAAVIAQIVAELGASGV
jgi:hypothetical protein